MLVGPFHCAVLQWGPGLVHDGGMASNAHLFASPWKVEPRPPLHSKFETPRLEMGKQPHLYFPRRPYFIHTAPGIHWGCHEFLPLVGANLMLRFGGLGQRAAEPLCSG